MKAMVRRSKAMGISLPKKVWKEIDRRRGLISRSAYIRELIRKGLEAGIDEQIRKEYECRD